MSEVIDPEAVGENFDFHLLKQAQLKTWSLLEELAELITPGMSEADATDVYKKLQLKSGADQYWHPPKIRFGKNTLCSFREKSDDDVRLKDNDIFFLDLGPIYEGYEGDCGRTFILGDFAEAENIQEACESIFQLVREKFYEGDLSGEQLYSFAEGLAHEAGYELVGEGANGHRVSEFPHAAHFRGPLRGWAERAPAPNRWILEIQLRDRVNQIGAFYEDLLS